MFGKPRQILPLRHSQPLNLHGREASQRVESHAQSSLPPHELMARAGQALAQWVLAKAPHAQQVWIAAGPGNNGGDGFELAQHLIAAGKRVSISTALPAQAGPTDAEWARQRAQKAGAAWVIEPPPLRVGDIAIDALLGVGTRRPPDGAIAQLITQLNQCICPVLAVDLPSGLCPNTGRLLGHTAVRAHSTLSLLTLKPGLFTAAGRDHAGEVWWSNLEVDTEEPADAYLIGPTRLTDSGPAHSAHKGSRGDVLIVGGATGMTGAAWLAASAAHAAGAGRVFVSLLSTQPIATLDTTRPELMYRPWPWPPQPETLARLTVVAGCGGGEAIAAALPDLLRHAGRLVLDADGLNAVAQDTALLHLLQSRATNGLITILTPHPLEAARVLDQSTDQIQSDRLTAARQLTEKTGAWVALKGSGTIVAGPGETPWINASGNASLATAGTGDVLAGWMGGHWAGAAARTPDAPSNDIVRDVAISTVGLHGRAADQAGINPLRAKVLIEEMLRQKNTVA